MPSANNTISKTQLARLTALTLIFSYAELLIPRIIPFFRLGLGNTVILMSFNLPFPYFILLTLLKSICSSLLQGTLLSPFFLISLCQGISSSLLMWALFKLNQLLKNKFFSLAGISLLGSALSAVVQIAFSSIYLGQGIFYLLGPMLLFNTASGIITALLALYIQNEYSKKTGGGCLPLGSTASASLSSASAFSPTPSSGETPRNAPEEPFYRKTFVLQYIFIGLLLIASVSLFFIKNIYVLSACLLMSFIAQKLCKRKILLLPHLSLWLFAILSQLFIPSGKVLFSILGFNITQDALLIGLQKAIRLSAVSALSQCAVCIKTRPGSLITLSIEYYRTMTNTFRSTEGSVLAKLRAVII